MTIRHIRIFISVYRAMNMTRAAEELHMAQPAVTRAIQEMEHYCGVRLFERLGRHLAATECAKELYGYAVHIDDTFAVMERRLRGWDTAGVLRVGATIAIGNYELPRIARRFQAENPDVKLRARRGRAGVDTRNHGRRGGLSPNRGRAIAGRDGCPALRRRQAYADRARG